jgi:SAM-dependent methyltransferase
VRRRLDRAEGRRLFGSDTEAYDRARPGHADGVYEILEDVCGLGTGTKVLEVGAGTGQATARLLELGAHPLVCIEPDPAMAAFLGKRFADRVELREHTLEDAKLETDFDLAVAASSFHWVEEDDGLARLRGALRPGGFVALWWTVFGDRARDDPFRDAVDSLLRDLPRSPSQADSGRPSWALDGEARTGALERSGFDEIGTHGFPWATTWDVEGIRGLYGTFSPILSLEPQAREELLDAIARIAARDFGGLVEKPLQTVLYVARRPP